MNNFQTCIAINLHCSFTQYIKGRVLLYSRLREGRQDMSNLVADKSIITIDKVFIDGSCALVIRSLIHF